MIYRSAAQTCVQVIKKKLLGHLWVATKRERRKKDQCVVNFHRRHKDTRNDHLVKSLLRFFFLFRDPPRSANFRLAFGIL